MISPTFPTLIPLLFSDTEKLHKNVYENICQYLSMKLHHDALYYVIGSQQASFGLRKMFAACNSE